MPKEGYKSVTIPLVVWEKLQEEFKQNRGRLANKGITNFTAFCIVKLNKGFRL